MRKKKESPIVAAIIKELRARGYWAMKIVAHPLQDAGIADILAIGHKGRAAFLEVKRPDDSVIARIQAHTLMLQERQGALCAIVESVDEAVSVMWNNCDTTGRTWREDFSGS